MNANELQKLLKLQSWFSPGFPTGAYAYSHGLEAAVEAGAVRNSADLRDWIETILLHGSGRADAYFFLRTENCTPHEAALLANEARAWNPTAELAAESEMQGNAFLQTVRVGWPHTLLDQFVEELEGRPPLSVAAGFCCAVHQLAVRVALVFHLQESMNSIISAGQRAIPIGQSDAQRIIADIQPAVVHAATRSYAEPATATPALEIYSMRHESQYSRVFRS